MRFVIFIIAILTSGIISAQQISDKKLQKDPYWIAMINDSTTNYFEAVHAFEQYWSVRPLPTEEDEILAAGADYEMQEGFFDRLITTKKERAEKQSMQYAFEYKRFKQWQIRVEPWVRPDGSITFPADQLRIMQDANK